jgi:hypothetical protein
VKHPHTSFRAAGLYAVLAMGAALFGVQAALTAPVALAQNLGERTVSGTVLSESSEPVVGATVFLRNEKSKTIRSYTSDNAGHFHFAQVNMAEDFDLWAEKNGHKSAVKTVSSWDARKDFVSDLKLK